MRSKVVYLLALCLLTAGFQSCGTQGPEIQSQWNGARVAFLGDSITDEGQLKSQDIYWHQLVKILGIKPFCYGISGHQTSHILGQAEKLNDEHGQDVDAIIIFIGTNDFHIDSTLRFTKQVILLTPIHRGYFNCAPKNIQQDENLANPLGLYIDDYIQVIKETADVWAVPVIDLASVCGLFPLEPEHARYFRESGMTVKYTPTEAAAAIAGTEQGLEHHDLLHPNTEGHFRMAYALAYQLLGYPSHF